MGVCSSNVYPTLLFDQVPAQSSALRLVSELLTLPRQPGRDGTGTGLSPLQSPGGAGPITPCQHKKGEPRESLGCHIPATAPVTHRHISQGRRGPQGWPIPAPHPCPTQRPSLTTEPRAETSPLSPVKPVRAAPHLPLYPAWPRCTWKLLGCT